MNPSPQDRCVSECRRSWLAAAYIYPHHRRTSGYAQLCNHLPSRPLLSTNIPFSGGDEGSVKWRISRRLFDLTILGASLRADLLHFLYTENHLRLLFKTSKRLNPRLKLVGTLHQPLGYYTMENSLAALRCLDGIITLTSNQASEIRAALPEKNVWFVPHGGVFEKGPLPPDTSFGGPSFDIIVVGSNYRDWQILGEIIKQASGRFPNWKIHLVGAGERNRTRFGHCPNVTIHPRLSDEQYAARLRTSRVLLLPLTFATANNALLEAHSAGLPTVCSDLPGVHDYSISSTRFFRDTTEAIAQLEGLAAMDESSTKVLRTKTLEEGRRFDWPNIAREITQIYNELLHRRD